MQKSKIEWTDYTWNPITGCTKGCEYCYARKKAENPFYKKAFPYRFVPHFYPERLKELSKVPAGSKVFVCSMGELFGDNPLWTEQVLNTIGARLDVTNILLTKQSQNLIKWSPFPDNCWVGVSATNYKMANQARWYLGNIKAPVRFLSVEPFLSPLEDKYGCTFEFTGGELNWLIIGSQTQPVKHPDKGWVDSLIKEADRYRIPVFVKEPLASHLNINRREYPNG